MKKSIHITILLTLVTVILSLSFLIIEASNHSLTVVAQEVSPTGPPPVPTISQETLAALGLSAADLTASASDFDLGIIKRTSVSSVTSGSLVTFTISVENSGFGPVPNTLFFDDLPAEMQNVKFIFSTAAISDGLAKPTWLFTEPISPNQTVVVTITGILTSPTDIRVTNTAAVTAFAGVAETNLTNNFSSVAVNIVGYNPIPNFYLPIIYRPPTPTPTPPVRVIFSDNFANTGSGWFQGNSDNSNCSSKYDSGRYRIDVNAEDRDCFRPAPSSAEVTVGTFQISAYVSEGSGNPGYGMYIDGRGGDNQYLLKIFPNYESCTTGGNWELLKISGGNRTQLLSGSCQAAIKRGVGSGAINVIKLQRTSAGRLSVTINDTSLGTYTDTSALSGEGVGVYARAESNDAVLKYDDFRVTVP